MGRAAAAGALAMLKASLPPVGPAPICSSNAVRASPLCPPSRSAAATLACRAASAGPLPAAACDDAAEAAFAEAAFFSAAPGVAAAALAAPLSSSLLLSLASSGISAATGDGAVDSCQHEVA